jgi:hypothetical protein
MLPGRWLEVDTGPVRFGLNDPPIFFSHPDTLLVGGQGTQRTVTGPGGFVEVSPVNPFSFYRRVSPRGFGERIFSHDANSTSSVDIRASDNRGRTWRPLDWPGINQPNFTVLSIASYPTEPGPWGDASTLPLGRLVFGAWSGVVLSDDNGETATPGGLFDFEFMRYRIHQITVLARPEGGLRIVAMGSINGGGCGCSRVWTSDDHGATFVQRALLNDPLSPNSNTAAALLPQVPREGGGLWIAGPAQATPSWQTSTAVAVLYTGIIYHTTDAGLTWQQAPPPYDRIPFEEPQTRNRVFSALSDSEGRLYPSVLEFGLEGADGFAWAIRSTAGYPVAGEALPAPASRVGLAVSVRPNPSSGAVTISVAVAAASSVRVVVVDALGRTVVMLHDGVSPAGDLSLALNTSRLAPGVYVVRAESGASSATARLVVSR